MSLVGAADSRMFGPRGTRGIKYGVSYSRKATRITPHRSPFPVPIVFAVHCVSFMWEWQK